MGGSEKTQLGVKQSKVLTHFCYFIALERLCLLFDTQESYFSNYAAPWIVRNNWGDR